MFANLLVNQKEDSLAYQMMKIQNELNLPGLVFECKQYIVDLKLPNIFEERIKKNAWKKKVKESIVRENEKELKQDMQTFKKLKQSELINEKFGMRKYVKELNVNEARTLFKHRCKMTRYVKMNYKNEPKYLKSLWKCQNCSNMDSESHILWCKEYSNLREDKNLQNIKDLSQYIQKVVKLREKQEENKKDKTKVDNTPAVGK